MAFTNGRTSTRYLELLERQRHERGALEARQAVERAELRDRERSARRRRSVSPSGKS